MSRTTIVLLSVLACAAAWEAIAMLEPKPDKFKHQEGCYLKDLDRVIPFGESIPSTKGCFKYSCTKDKVKITGCSLAVAKPPLELIEEKDKPFPACCPRLKST